MPPNSSYQSIVGSRPPQHLNGNDEESKNLLPMTLQQCDSSSTSNSTSNSTYEDKDDSFPDFLGKQMKKRPMLIFSIMLLLACSLGHTLTILYYWDDIKGGKVSSNSNNDYDDNDHSSTIAPFKINGSANNKTVSSTKLSIESLFKEDEKESESDKAVREMQKETLKEIQSYANEQKRVQLDEPSLESEKYYNHTLSALLETTPMMAKSKTENHSNSKLSPSSTSTPPPPPPPYDCQATIMIIRHCEKGDIREHCNIIGKLHDLTWQGVIDFVPFVFSIVPPSSLFQILMIKLTYEIFHSQSSLLQFSIFNVLLQKGFERAKFLATLFGNGNERWPSPYQIYALSPGARNNKLVQNMREIETVTPLSQKINVSIDDSYGLSNIDQFTSHLMKSMRSGDFCNKMVLISWKHDNIPNLAARLGCGPNNGCPTKYDDMDFDSAWELRYVYRKEEYATYPVAEKKHKKHKPWGLHPEWWVFGKVEKEGFDPLAFSKELGTF